MNQSRARTWALFGVVLSLSACGGGGGDAGSSSPTPPPPPAQEEVLVAGVAKPSGLSKQLVVVDPAQPVPARLSTPVESYMDAYNFSLDATQRRATERPATMGYFIRGGQVFQVNLRKNQSNVPQRISSTYTACTVDDWHALNLSSGDDGWIEVTEAGPDLNCNQADDNRKIFVRHGTPITTAATVLPTGVAIMGSLPDPVNNTLSGFIARDTRTTPSRLSLYSSTLSFVGDVAGSSGVTPFETLFLRPGQRLTSSAYVKTGSSLRRLDWSASSASMSAALYSFATSSDDVQLSDSSAMYFVDGLSVRRMEASGAISLLATLDPSLGNTASLRGLTPGHVIIEQGSTTSNVLRVISVPKLGGMPVRLAPTQGTIYVVGVRGNEVIYSTYPSVGSTKSIRRIRADGSNDELISVIQISYAMPVYSPVYAYSTYDGLEMAMWCDVPAGGGNCRSGTIRSYDMQSRQTVALGTLANTNPDLISLYVDGWGYTDRPGLLSASGTVLTSTGFESMTDLYLFRPGTANSLVRLTNYIP